MTYSFLERGRLIKGELLGPPQVSYASEPRGRDFNREEFGKFYRRHMRQRAMFETVDKVIKSVLESSPGREICPEDLGVITRGSILEYEDVSDPATKDNEASMVRVLEALQVVRKMPYGRFSITGASPYRVDDGQLVVCNTHPGEASPFLGVVGVGILSQTVEDMEVYRNGSRDGPGKNNFDHGRAFDELFKSRILLASLVADAGGVLIGEILSETDIGGPKPTMGDHPVHLYLPVTYLAESVGSV